VFAKAFRALHGTWPDPAAAGGYNAVEVLALTFQAAGGTKPDAVVKAMETLRFKDSILGEYSFRECDHAGQAGVFVVEGKFNEEYRYYPAFIEQVENPGQLMVPCGKTGCEPLMKS
jgi:ABC-type branched-subunit amino acid transport system substrate-binding protein